MLRVTCYTIYHSPNAYLGVRIAARELAGLAVTIERRPIAIPRARGVKVAELVGSGESPRQGAYTREDCARWAGQYGIEIRYLPPGEFERRAERWAASPFEREELPARAYYAASGSGKEAALDRALFEAAWIHGLDVNEEAVVRGCAAEAGLDPDALLASAFGDAARRDVEAALAAFDEAECPGVPTFVLDGERFWGKDRVAWLADRIRERTGAA